MSEKESPLIQENDDPRLERLFKTLRQPVPRDPLMAAQTRQVFLQEAHKLSEAVSGTQKRRRIGWMQPIQNLFLRKEHSPMFTVFSTLLIILSLIVGGTGVSVAAAQSSLPDQPLYALKLFTEQVRLALNKDSEQELQLSLEFATRRVNEIQAMIQNEDLPPEPVQGRYQEQVEQAFRLAVGMPDERALQALEQIHQRLREQEQMLLHLGQPKNPQSEAVLLRTRQMIQERLRLAEEGLEDPARLRELFRNGMNETPGQDNGNRQPTESPVPGSGYGPGDGDCPGCAATPGSGYGPGDGTCPNCTPQKDASGGNPWTDTTPTPGSGYGPGDGDCPNCTSQGNPSGGNPWTDTTPTPGSGYGPGPQPTSQPGTPVGPQGPSHSGSGKP